MFGWFVVFLSVFHFREFQIIPDLSIVQDNVSHVFEIFINELSFLIFHPFPATFDDYVRYYDTFLKALQFSMRLFKWLRLSNLQNRIWTFYQSFSIYNFPLLALPRRSTSTSTPTSEFKLAGSHSLTSSVNVCLWNGKNKIILVYVCLQMQHILW